MIEWFIMTLMQGVNFVDKHKSGLALVLLAILGILVVIACTNAASVICNFTDVQNGVCPSWLLEK